MNRSAHKVLNSRIWRGQTVYIVGGGPSLRDFDFSTLNGRPTIVVNRAFESVPDADVFITMDGRFLRTYQEGLAHFAGHKIFVENGPLKGSIPDGILTCPGIGEKAISQRLSWGLGHGNNSGFCAINLALVLGAERVVLLGFDLLDRESTEPVHYHSGYPWNSTSREYARFRDNFNWLARIKWCKDKIFNFNPNSGIRCFPFIESFDDLPEVRIPVRPIVACAYYTNDYYRIEGSRLVASCADFNLPVHFESWDDQGDWTLNTQEKAKFLLHMMDNVQGRDILYLDADAVVRKDPIPYLTTIPRRFNLSAAWRKSELLSGTLLLVNNELTRKMLERWVRLNDTKPEWDQRTLQRVWGEYPGHCYKLPPEFTFIFDISRREHPGVEPVIEHFQASRRFRRLINNA